MKYLLSILTFLTISCNAQIVSLETIAQCRATSNCPNYNYIKDINNSLSKYIGTWIGNYNGKTYELQFKKILDEDFGVKSDMLKGRMRIKDSNGNIVYDTFNESDDAKTKFSGFGFQPNLKYYMMHFVGNSPFACGEMGYVYLGIKPETPNVMTIRMIQDADIVWGECPSNYQPTIPYNISISLIRQ
ncbi:DUF6705 family protein [Epilithonimonas tenax]|uniref:DUF6705 family protein n=1 Tax=Epilithonimonas tenax TaxID=191577 RepID=UPI000403C96E|nr:DUF6705 family protein [Epilithonimonas tenax]